MAGNRPASPRSCLAHPAHDFLLLHDHGPHAPVELHRDPLAQGQPHVLQHLAGVHLHHQHPACCRGGGGQLPAGEGPQGDRAEQPDALAGAASKSRRVLVVEMNAGQMLEDVRLALGDRLPVEFYGRMGAMIVEEEEIVRRCLKR